jgi:hypothetical protein
VIVIASNSSATGPRERIVFGLGVVNHGPCEKLT